LARELNVLAQDDAEFILYKWTEGMTYESLTAEKIKQSMNEADAANEYRKNTSMEIENIIKDISNPNFEITEDDMEQIDEFLSV